jgi:hypothetical protein
LLRAGWGDSEAGEEWVQKCFKTVVMVTGPFKILRPLNILHGKLYTI